MSAMSKGWALSSVYAAVTFLTVSSCGGAAGRPDAPATTTGAADSLQYDALPVPAGVDAGTWALLTDELARVLAERSAGVKAASAPPTGENGAVELTYDEEPATISWLYANSGDYDQNGIVGVSDLTPLGVHFGEESPDGAGQPFPSASLGSAIDGNGDGLIEVADVTPIGQNFGVRVAGYNLYTSADAQDYPLEPTDPSGAGAELAEYIDLADALGGTAGRKRFDYALPEDAAPGVYWVRPTDGETDGAASNALALGTANLPPIAVLSAEPTVGFVPLTIELRAFYSADLDGEIVSYEWDFDGPIGGEQWTEPAAQGWIEHSYEQAGDYLAAVRVTDDGGATAAAHAVIKAKQPIPPVAELTATPNVGNTPLHVVFDASGSSDADGPIADYSWDWQSDGIFDYDSGTAPTADFYAYDRGTITTTVRVTDLDGLTATAQASVLVHSGASWHTTTAVMDEEDYTLSVRSLIDIAGNPAIGYRANISDSNQLLYMRSNDEYGLTWDEPVILSDVVGGAYGQVSMINGRPAACWYISDGDYAGLRYLRSNDEQGLDWPDPVMLMPGPGNVLISLKQIGSHPAVVSHHGSSGESSSYTYAEDPVGSEWGGTYEIGVDVHYGGFQEIAGLPAFTYTRGDALFFVRAFNIEGSIWPLPTIVDYVGEIADGSRLVDADGNPAIAYYNDTFQTLQYVRALDSAGTDWGESLALDVNVRAYLSMGLIDGRPAIIYGERTKGALKFIVANDAEGESWGLPMEADPNTDNSGNPNPGFCAIGDRPAFAYDYAHGEYQIRLAMYY